MTIIRNYRAIVRRQIVDEIEITVEAKGNYDALEIEQQVEALAEKVPGIDPGAPATKVKATMTLLTLIDEQDTAKQKAFL